jgi:hypothetical protein
MTTEQKNDLIDKLRLAAKDLAEELAKMHGTLLNVITSLRVTTLREDQRQILDVAMNELKASQTHFFSTYMDDVGVANPENN